MGLERDFAKLVKTNCVLAMSGAVLELTHIHLI